MYRWFVAVPAELVVTGLGAEGALVSAAEGDATPAMPAPVYGSVAWTLNVYGCVHGCALVVSSRGIQLWKQSVRLQTESGFQRIPCR